MKIWKSFQTWISSPFFLLSHIFYHKQTTLLFHFIHFSSFFAFIHSLFHAYQTQPNIQNPRNHFLQHGTELAEGVKSKRWKWWWTVLTWTIWQHRNKAVFQNVTFHGSKLLDDALLLLWSWTKAMDKDFTLHFNQWSSNMKEGFCN